MKPERLIAYNGSEWNKAAILAQLKKHAEADEIIKGKYWENGKGCAVGCTIHSGNHAEYEPRFGVPQMLARLEDVIFEGLPNGKAKAWPIEFMSAIQPGADLSRVGWRFLHWLLTDERVNPGINHPLVRDAVKACADVLVSLSKGNEVDESAAESASRAAWSAACSVEAASRAVEAAAWSAESAATAARSAAESAVGSAAAAAESARVAAAGSARSARSAAYLLMSEKLLELIREAGLSGLVPG